MSFMLYDARHLTLAEAIRRLAHANPFSRERRVAERALAGDGIGGDDEVWHRSDDDEPPWIRHIGALAEEVAEYARRRLVAGVKPSDGEAELHADVAAYVLYHRHRVGLLAHAISGASGPVAWFDTFAEDARALLALPGLPPLASADIGGLFAFLFQVRRAFHHIFEHLVGGSAPMARLRAAAWQSTFTHDLPRYRRGLFMRMGDIATLITGESGTGKELVARAIAQSRHMPFDPVRRAFTGDTASAFLPLHLAALSPTLVESELFGHRRGAFTGATSDRAGWLETCPEHGAVFLDEVGEVDAMLQVKLLRALHERTFQRLGDTASRRFRGKIIAATNRDLSQAIAQGGFREDFYYRLCADRIRTPSLREQLADRPQDLPALVRHIAGRVAGDGEAEGLAAETLAWIGRGLPAGYPWPGNVRELEQCVRNVLVRGSYSPEARPAIDATADLSRAVAAGELAADALLDRYCALVGARAGSWREAGRRLGIDWRTAKVRAGRVGAIVSGD